MNINDSDLALLLIDYHLCFFFFQFPFFLSLRCHSYTFTLGELVLRDWLVLFAKPHLDDCTLFFYSLFDKIFNLFTFLKQIYLFSHSINKNVNTHEE